MALRLAVLAALPLMLALAPNGAALPFEGPGQTGAVPLGDDGLVASLGLALPGPLADNLSEVRLDGIPAGACRLVLDANGTFAATHVLWAPGAPGARIYADTAAHDAPFRVHAVWHTDLNGRCTAEQTEAGTLWHDPRGRPFVDLRVVERKPVVDVQAGMRSEIELHVHNNGTLPDNVTGRIAGLPAGWQGGSTGPTSNVPIEPLATAGFSFRVDIPADANPRMTVVRVGFTATEWSQEVLVFLQFPADAPVPTTSAGPRPAATPDAAAPPRWTPAAEAPASSAPFLVLLVCLLLLTARRAGPRRGPARP